MKRRIFEITNKRLGFERFLGLRRAHDWVSAAVLGGTRGIQTSSAQLHAARYISFTCGTSFKKHSALGVPLEWSKYTQIPYSHTRLRYFTSHNDIIQRKEAFRRFLIESKFRPGDPVPDEFADLYESYSEIPEDRADGGAESGIQRIGDFPVPSGGAKLNEKPDKEDEEHDEEGKEDISYRIPRSVYDKNKKPIAFKLTNREMIQDSIELDIRRMDALGEQFVYTDLVSGGFLRSVWSQVISSSNIPQRVHRPIMRSLASNVRSMLMEHPDISSQEFSEAVREIVFEEAERNCASQLEVLQLFFPWAFLTNGPIALPNVPGQCHIIGRIYSDARNAYTVAPLGRRRTIVILFKSDDPNLVDTLLLARYVIGNYSLHKQSTTISDNKSEDMEHLESVVSSDTSIQKEWDEAVQELDEEIDSVSKKMIHTVDVEGKLEKRASKLESSLSDLRDSMEFTQDVAARLKEIELKEEDQAWMRIMKLHGFTPKRARLQSKRQSVSGVGDSNANAMLSRFARADPNSSQFSFEEMHDEEPLENSLDATTWLQRPYAVSYLHKNEHASEIAELLDAAVRASPDDEDVVEFRMQRAKAILARRIFSYYQRPRENLAPDASQVSEFNSKNFTSERIELLKKAGVNISEEELKQLSEQEEEEKLHMKADLRVLGLEGIAEEELKNLVRDWKEEQDKLVESPESNVDSHVDIHDTISASDNDTTDPTKTIPKIDDSNYYGLEEMMWSRFTNPLADPDAELGLEGMVRELYEALDDLYEAIDARGGKTQPMDLEQSDFSAQDLYEQMVTLPPDQRKRIAKLKGKEKEMYDLARGVNSSEHITVDLSKYPTLHAFTPLIEASLPVYMHIEGYIFLTARLIEYFSNPKLNPNSIATVQTEAIALECMANTLAGYALTHMEIVSFMFPDLPPLGSWVRIPGLYGSQMALASVYIDHRSASDSAESRVNSVGFPLEGPGRFKLLAEYPVLRLTQFTKMRVRDGYDKAKKRVDEDMWKMQEMYREGKKAKEEEGKGEVEMMEDSENSTKSLAITNIVCPELDVYQDAAVLPSNSDPPTTKFPNLLEKAIASMPQQYPRELTVIMFYVSSHFSMKGKVIKATYIYDRDRVNKIATANTSQAHMKVYEEKGLGVLPNYVEIVDRQEVCDNRAMDPFFVRLRSMDQLPKGVSLKRPISKTQDEDWGEHSETIWKNDEVK